MAASDSAPAETNGISSHQHDEEKGLHRTATAVTMSPELFEKVRHETQSRRGFDYGFD